MSSLPSHDARGRMLPHTARDYLNDRGVFFDQEALADLQRATARFEREQRMNWARLQHRQRDPDEALALLHKHYGLPQ